MLGLAFARILDGRLPPAGLVPPFAGRDDIDTVLEDVDVADLGRVDDHGYPLVAGAGSRCELMRMTRGVAQQERPRGEGDEGTEGETADEIAQIVHAKVDAADGDRESEHDPEGDDQTAAPAAAGEHDGQQDGDGEEHSCAGGVPTREGVAANLMQGTRPWGAVPFEQHLEQGVAQRFDSCDDDDPDRDAPFAPPPGKGSRERERHQTRRAAEHVLHGLEHRNEAVVAFAEAEGRARHMMVEVEQQGGVDRYQDGEDGEQHTENADEGSEESGACRLGASQIERHGFTSRS